MVWSFRLKVWPFLWASRDLALPSFSRFGPSSGLLGFGPSLCRLPFLGCLELPSQGVGPSILEQAFPSGEQALPSQGFSLPSHLLGVWPFPLRVGLLKCWSFLWASRVWPFLLVPFLVPVDPFLAVGLSFSAFGPPFLGFGIFRRGLPLPSRGWLFPLRIWPFLLGVWRFLLPVGPSFWRFGPSFWKFGPSFSVFGPSLSSTPKVFFLFHNF